MRSSLTRAGLGALLLCVSSAAWAQSAATPNPPEAPPPNAPEAPPPNPPVAPPPNAPQAPSPATSSGATPDRVAEADRAFKEAGKRMDARDFAGACPLLERSQALDPSSGTLLNLGDCYEQLGRTASAWRAFTEARALATATARLDRADVADARARRLAPALPRLSIVPPAPSPNELVIRLDDAPVVPAMFNTPLPIDPGAHTVRANATGLREYSTQLMAPASGVTTQLVIPQLQPAGTMAASSLAVESSQAPLDGQQIAAIAAGSVGVVGIALGTVFGLRSMSKHRESDDNCHGAGGLCNSTGVQAMEDARAAGNISTVSFVLGGLGLGAGAVLWFARPFGRDESAHTAVRMGPGSVTLEGTW